MHAGKAIQFFQVKNNITGVELAEKANITPQQLSRWRGSEDMKLSSIIDIANAMGVSVSEFAEKAASL